MADDIFSGIKGAKASKDANYIRPGVYVLFIDRIKQDKNREDIPFVAVETTVLATLTKETNDDGVVVSHKPGESVTDMYMAGGKGKDMFLPNIKAMVMSLVGCAADDVDPEACKVMVSDAQPMAGIVCKVQAREIITKTTGNTYTKVTYQGPMWKEDFAELGIPVPEGAVFADSIPGYAQREA